MSRHVGRNETWHEVSAKRYNGNYGYVQLNSFGMWDAILVFKQRPPLQRKGQPKKDRPWSRMTKHCGEHRRARQAMMAVEEAAKKLKAESDPDKVI